MDLPRKTSAWQRWRQPRRQSLLALGLLLLTALSLAVWALSARPAQLSVSARSLTLATVEQGSLDVTVRGAGVLLPSDPQWITAQSEARVQRIHAPAGSPLKAGALILSLSNPALQQKAQESRWLLDQFLAELRALQLSLDSQLLSQQAAVQRAQAAADTARLQLQADEELLKDGLISKLAFHRSTATVQQTAQALVLEQQLLRQQTQSAQAQLDGKRAALARQQKALARDQELLDALQVRSPIDGIVQELSLQVGQSVTPGALLAKLARPDALYAEVQIPESQARDLQIGQNAELDLRTGQAADRMQGRVDRIAPKVSQGMVKVDVTLTGPLSRGARPDLSVDGSIHITELAHCLQVQRPLASQAHTQGSVFRVDDDGHAQRVPVQFGAASVQRIEIRSGLKPGERIVVSDTASWQAVDRIRIH